MNKLIYFLLIFFSIEIKTFFNYMNDTPISFKSELTGDAAAYLDYNILNNGDGGIGGDIRVCGIHNMSVTVQGYETIDLIKNDVCLYPNLFTILGSILWNSNVLVQRWACVKWFLPLYFGFKLQENELIIFSSLSQSRIFSPLRAKKVISLVQAYDFNPYISDQDRDIKIYVNGRMVVIKPKAYLCMYSSSSFHPYAVLARQLFL